MSYIIVFLIAWFYSTLLHELSHAFFAKRRGATIKGIYPYWHWYWWQHDIKYGLLYRCVAGLPYPIGKPPVEGARFRFAGYVWEAPRDNKPTRIEHLAPVLGDAATTLLALLLLPICSWYAATFILTSVIDTTVWTLGYLRDKPGTDGYKFRHYKE